LRPVISHPENSNYLGMLKLKGNYTATVIWILFRYPGETIGDIVPYKLGV
jgi:hypothetical protein